MAETPCAEIIAARLSSIESGQSLINRALTLVVETLQQQMEMLSKIEASAKDDAAQSPFVQSLDELTQAVMRMGADMQTISARLDGLPGDTAAEVIGRIGLSAGQSAGKVR